MGLFYFYHACLYNSYIFFSLAFVYIIIVGTHRISIHYTSFIDDKSVTDRNPVGSYDVYFKSLNS